MPGCFTMTDLCMARLSRRAADGLIDYGNPIGSLDLAGLSSIAWTDQLTTVQEFEKLDGCGDLCYYDKKKPLIKYSQVTITGCRTSWELDEIVGVATLAIDDTTDPLNPVPFGAKAIGGASCGASAIPPSLVLEAWGKLRDCNGVYRSGVYRCLFPRITNFFFTGQGLKLGPEDAVLTADAFAGLVGDGPFHDIPVGWETLGERSYPYGYFEDDDIPTPNVLCDYNALPAAS